MTEKEKSTEPELVIGPGERVYIVNDERLVVGASRQQAVGYCARQAFKARLATQGDIVRAMARGARPEHAGKEGA